MHRCGQALRPGFRAPGGRTSPQLLNAAKACGYAHVGWAPAGFLGDELPSEKYSNQRLLDVKKTLAAGEPVWWEDEKVFATHTMEK